MLGDYVGLLLIFLIGLALVAGLLVVHRVRGTSQVGEDAKSAPESEETGVSQGRRHALEFHTVAIFFVVFATQSVYFHAFGAVQGELRWYGLAVMAIFALPLVVGLYYGWMKDGFRW